MVVVTAMPIPTALADRTLLEAEPFKTAFFAYREAALERRRERRSQQRESVPGPKYGVDRKSLEEKDALDAAQAWIGIAFRPSPKDRNIIDVTHVTDELLDVFVEFYWLLSITDERSAEAYLLKQRKRRGFYYSVEDRDFQTCRPDVDAKNEVIRQKSTVASANKHALSEPEAGPSTKRANISFSPGVDELPASSAPKLRKKKVKSNKQAPTRVQPPRYTSCSQQLPPFEKTDTSTTQLQAQLSSLDVIQNVSSSIPDSTTVRVDKSPSAIDDAMEDVIVTVARDTLPSYAPKTAKMPVPLGKLGAKKPKLQRTKGSGDTQRHVAKRRKSGDGTSIPVELQEETSTLSVAGPISALGSKRTRVRSISAPRSFEDVNNVQRTSPQPVRTTVALPKSRLKTVPNLPLPTPAPDHRIPRTPEDLDNIIRNAAAEAHVLLNTVDEPRAEEWVHEDQTYAEETSDEEDETPLWLQASQRKNVAGSTAMALPGLPAIKGRVSAPAVVHSLFPKPPLPGYPPIWAESRQEVCESFDWFRSYQGGVYSSHDMVKGYLLSAFSANRDLFHHRGKLIISHGGGRGAESIHKSPSEVLHASDQLAEDRSVRALLRTMKLRRPLVLLIDDKYSGFPFDLSSRGCVYAVLGFYRIAYAWAERQPGSTLDSQVVRYKFAFQWCQEQGDPWWWSGAEVPSQTSEDLQSSAPDLHLLRNLSTNENVTNIDLPTGNNHSKCTSCNQPTPQVYTEGWMCLRPSCSSFFTLKGHPPPASLSYSNTFLQPIPFRHDHIVDIRPPPPPQNSEDGIMTGRHACKGWHCRKCGRLSSRFKWEHWECRNCGNVLTVYGGLRSAAEFRHQIQGTHFTQHRHSVMSGIFKSNTQMYNYGRGFSTFVTFTLPFSRGHIHVIFSSPFANQTADAILAGYQEEAVGGNLKFRRWPLRSHKCRGALLTNYFSQNTGEPYHYVAGTENTVPWSMAPAAVEAARKLINERMVQALGLNYHFNEVLSAGYMEKQKMAFHSDAERGLGGTVASLSLGASAYMHFRLHSQFINELPNKCSREVLSLYLRHGDVVVMQGPDIQKYYEHTVVPLNFRIAATARFIDNSSQ